jgi:hypothetical protein
MYWRIHSETTEKAMNICKNNGGLSFLRVDSINNKNSMLIFARCNDGAKFDDTTILNVEF